MARWPRRAFRWAAATAGLAAAGLGGLAWLDQAFPPALDRYQSLSQVVADRQGRPLRIYLTADDSLRLPLTTTAVEPLYLQALIAYEDKRFHSHPGVDPLALVRAFGQLLWHGRVVSGASTLTMQAARLLEPRPRRLSAKLVEMARALQLERRLTKQQILDIYLTLAPFGGNIEGVRAASLAYFGREPAHLSLDEAALLVALPQAPSRLRPDRYPAAATAARNRVLRRISGPLALAPEAIKRATDQLVARQRHPTPFLAPHLANRLRRGAPDSQALASTIDAQLQRRLEQLAGRSVRFLGPAVSAAILVVDNRTRAVRAYVGSADFHAASRAGQVNMVTAVRSPGSTLKPLIYAMAFERHLVHPATLVDDAPQVFGSYAPRNFGKKHYGLVTLTQALQLSLNVPAVAVLDRLGPVAFTEALSRHGVTLRFPGAALPGLSLALGGAGASLEELVRLYAALADDGQVRPLLFRGDLAHSAFAQEALLSPKARAQVTRILLGASRPRGYQPAGGQGKGRRIAFKTGTSYGYRDAWAIGYDRRHTVGVWIGRPDGTPSPGRFGLKVAAPVLFQVFDQLPAPPPDAWRDLLQLATAVRTADLPPGLRRLDRPGGQPAVGHTPSAPRIVFPLPGSLMIQPRPSGAISLQAEGGQRPYSWLVDGRLLGPASRRRSQSWVPDGPGFAVITLVDSRGQRFQTAVRIQPLPNAN